MDPQEDGSVKTKWISCPPVAHTPAENAGERNFCGGENRTETERFWTVHPMPNPAQHSSNIGIVYHKCQGKEKCTMAGEI